MNLPRKLGVSLGAGLLALVAAASTHAAPAIKAIANPAFDDVLAATPGQETAVLAGGCFWGVQDVFEHVKGVTKVTAGYAGGGADTAHYDLVSKGDTGHAESVEVTYDPSQVTYGQLLKIYFSVAHDPTSEYSQGPDAGTEYRSSIFFANRKQQRIAWAYIDQLNAANTFGEPVVTEVVHLRGFYPAESYHQDFAANHPRNPYIRVIDTPKITNLQHVYPEMYVDYSPAVIP